MSAVPNEEAWTESLLRVLRHPHGTLSQPEKLAHKIAIGEITPTWVSRLEFILSKLSAMGLPPPTQISDDCSMITWKKGDELQLLLSINAVSIELHLSATDSQLDMLSRFKFSKAGEGASVDF